MRTFLAVLFALAALVVAGIFMHRDPGSINVEWFGYVWQQSLGVAVLIIGLSFIAFYIVLRLLGLLLRGPKWLRIQREAGSQLRARARISEGLLQLAEGKYEDAERMFAYPSPEQGRLTHWLLAAQAAHAAEHFEARDAHIEAALDAFPAKSLAITLHFVALLRDSDPKRALSLLEALPAKKHPGRARLMVPLLIDAQRFDEAKQALRIAYKRGGGEALQERIFLGALALPEINQVKQAWEQHAEKSSLSHMAHYAQRLLELDDPAAAEPILATLLERGHTGELVRRWAHIDSANSKTQLERAEKWSERHHDHADLLYVLGVLCARQELWGRSKGYLEHSIALAPDAGSYRALADMLERSEDTEGAAAARLQALQHSGLA